jgi:hypothetical protein
MLYIHIKSGVVYSVAARGFLNSSRLKLSEEGMKSTAGARRGKSQQRWSKE